MMRRGKLSPEANDLVRALLEKDKFKRISATDALGHPWFQKYSSISERLKKPPPRWAAHHSPTAAAIYRAHSRLR
jgi:serine/threonine protein kinase